MKHLVGFFALIIVLTSCGNSSLVGNHYYVYDINLDWITAKEFQLDFISDSKVEVKTTLSLDSYTCKNYKTNPELTKQSIIMDYTFKDGMLEIPKLNVIHKCEFQANGDISTNSFETLYAKSLTEISDNKDEALKRFAGYVNGNEKIAEVFVRMLDNPTKFSVFKK